MPDNRVSLACAGETGSGEGGSFMRGFRKVSMSAAAVALVASGAVAFFAMPASAVTKVKGGKITCTQMNGSVVSTTITISNCSGTAVPGTGGSSMALSISVLANGGPVTWSNGQVTTFGAPTDLPTSAKKCPGYVKNGASNPTAVKFKGAIESDADAGLKLPGKYQGAVCIGTDSNATITALKPLKIS